MSEIESKIYTDNFWKGYDIIYEHYTKRREQFNKIYYLFSKLSTLYSNFGDELTEVFKELGLKEEEYSNVDLKGKGSFECDLNKFYNYIWKEAKRFQELGKKIQERIISEIFKNINFTNDLNTITGNTSNDENLYFKQVEKDYLENLIKLEDKKNQFQLGVDKKIKEIINPPFGLLKKKKITFHPETLTNEYIISLIETEKKRKDYISKYTKLLDYYYKTELNCIKSINTSFTAYSDYMKTIYQEFTNTNYEWKKEEGTKYIKEFVDKNRTIGLPPFQLDFMNYTVEAGNLFPDQNSQKDQEKKMQSIQEYMKNVSDYVYPLINDNKKEINVYVEKLFNGEFSDDDFDNLIKLFKEKVDSEVSLKKEKPKDQIQVPPSGIYDYVGLKNQMSFLGILNSKRTTTFEIPNKSFDHFVRLFQVIIELNKKSNDEIKSKIIGWCIILSQTFKQTVNGNSVYIQEKIQDEDIFQDSRFWINLCKHYIAENFYKSKHFTNFEVTMNEKDIKRTKSIAQSKLMSVVHNLTNFKVSEAIRNEVIDYLVDLYSINKKDISLYLFEEKNENPPKSESQIKNVTSNEIKNENANQNKGDIEKNNEK